MVPGTADFYRYAELATAIALNTQRVDQLVVQLKAVEAGHIKIYDDLNQIKNWRYKLVGFIGAVQFFTGSGALSLKNLLEALKT